jgi:hypothetical protein
LLDRVCDLIPLRCTTCGRAMRIIDFITDVPTVRDPSPTSARRRQGAPDRARPRPRRIQADCISVIIN